MEIGVDIEKNDRFNDLSQKFLKRVFSDYEISYAQRFQNSAQQLCSFWCVKEATVKAFSNLKMQFNQICILHDKNGKPYVEKNAQIERELQKLGLSDIKISISNSKDYSVAMCMIF